MASVWNRFRERVRISLDRAPRCLSLSAQRRNVLATLSVIVVFQIRIWTLGNLNLRVTPRCAQGDRTKGVLERFQ